MNTLTIPFSGGSSVNPDRFVSVPRTLGEAIGLAPAGGQKFDQAKLPMHLLDPLALEGLARVLQFGAIKYAPNNWRKGLAWARLIGALLRHVFAIMRGELIDPESGLPHIDHVGCCWMFLSNMMKTRPDLNDLKEEIK